MKQRTIATLLTPLFLAACAATAQEARVFNFRNLSYKNYVDGAFKNPDLQEREGVKAFATAWVMGYMTGRNPERPYDKGVAHKRPADLDGTKKAAQSFEAEVMRMVDAFCLANYDSGPASKSLSNAASHAMERLSAGQR